MTEAANKHYLLDANILAAFFRGKKNALNLVTPWIAHQEQQQASWSMAKSSSTLWDSPISPDTRLNCKHCSRIYTPILLTTLF